MAPVEPMVRATRSERTQPLPTLAEAPSPTGGNQGIRARDGQRPAQGSRNPLNGSVQSRRGES